MSQDRQSTYSTINETVAETTAATAVNIGDDIADEVLFNLSKSDKSLAMFGLGGMKFHGMDLESFGLNLENVETPTAWQLTLLQIRKLILFNLVFWFIDLYYSSIDLVTKTEDLRSFFFDSLCQLTISILQVSIYLPSYIKTPLILQIRRARRPKDSIEIIWKFHRLSLKFAKRNKKLPMCVQINMETPKFICALPPPIPEPYLTSDKKLVVPSKKEIDLALSLQIQYSNDYNLFRQTVKFDKRVSVSKIITYAYIVQFQDDIKFLKFYHSSGALWSDDPIQLVDFVLIELKNVLENDIDNLVDKRRQLKLVNFVNCTKYLIDPATLTYAELDWNKKDTEVEETENVFEVVFSSYKQNASTVYSSILKKSRIFQHPQTVDIEILRMNSSLTARPDLIINLNLDHDNMVKLKGMPYFPEQMPRDILIYNSNSKQLRFDHFYDGLKYYLDEVDL